MSFFEKLRFIFIEVKGFEMLMKGLGYTLVIAISALAIGLVLGTLIAVIKVTPKSNKGIKVLNVIADVYLTIMRGTPMRVFLLVMYFVVFAKTGLPNLGIAIIAFGLNSAAYLGEAIRAGILSVDKGQMEAGRSLGLSYPKTMLKVIIPQAIKNIIPALGNEFIALLKETSVASAACVVDLSKAAEDLARYNYDVSIPYLAMALIYLVVVLLFTLALNYLERRLRRSDNR